MKLHVHITAILLIVVLPIVYSCGNTQIRSTLSDVESFISERPDSALAVLSALDTNQLTGSKVWAKYSLLHTMALDKNGRNPDDIKVIEPAIEYYCKHGRAEEKMKAYFYYGRVNRYGGNYQDAILAGMEARKYAEKSRELYWRAMLASEIGYTHSNNYSNSESLKYLIEANDLWSEYGDSLRIRNARFNLGGAYHNCSQFSQADSVFAILCAEKDPDYDSFAFRADNELKSGGADYGRVVEWFETAISHGAHMTIENYYEYAYALAKVGKGEASQGIVQQLEAYPKDAHASYYLYLIAKNAGDYVGAVNNLETCMSQSDSVVRHQLEQSVYKAQADKYQYESNMLRMRQRDTMTSILLGLALLFAIGTAIVLRFRARRNSLEQRNETLALMYDESQRMIESIKTENEMRLASSEERNRLTERKLSHLRSSFAKMYQNQFLAIGKMLDYNSNDADAVYETARSEYADKAKQILESIKNEKGSRRAFEEMVNSELDGIMAKLRADYPSFTDYDFQFLSYVIVGFDATTRSILLNSSKNSMRALKSKLIKEIISNPTDNLELYKTFIGPKT